LSPKRISKVWCASTAADALREKRSLSYAKSVASPSPAWVAMAFPSSTPPSYIAKLAPRLEEYVVNGEKVPATHRMRAAVPFNLTGLSALSVPFMFSSEQLPINVHLVSRWMDEAAILRLGLLIEAGNKVNYRRANL
jgi:hypothetical protein